MKNHFYLALVVLFCSTSTMPMWALKDEASFKSQTLSSENPIVVKKSTTSIENDKSIVSFVVNTEQAGYYYLSCWMLGGKHQNGNYSSFDVSANGKSIGKMIATKSNWQSVNLNSGTIPLQKGENTISFTTQIPEIPNIEFIKLASTQESSAISSENYDERLRLIKEKCIIERGNYLSFSTDTIPTNNFNRAIAIDTVAHYEFKEQIPLKYTFHTLFQFTQGNQVNFSVSNISGSSTVLEIFSITNPENYTWSIIAGINQTKGITINIPSSGTYKVRARSLQNARDGIADVKVGTTTYTGVPTYSYGFTYTHEAGIEYNTFTANIKLKQTGEGDPLLFIGEGGFPDKIVGYNDDSQVIGEHDWEYNSRIKKTFARNTKSVLISESSSYNQSSGASCDLYIGCRNCQITTYYFENLHPNDVIESAPETPNYDYNCISWSGGITSYWEWPIIISSVYHVDGGALACFDNFYQSIRYDNCGIYSRNGATEVNSVVDLWGCIEDGEIEYTHASIKHEADNHPHGYDWESKAGALSRIFHPRYALEGDPYKFPGGGYGEVLEHYRLIGTGNSQTSTVSALQEGDRIMTLEESIAEGYSVLEHVRFTDTECTLINTTIRSISESNIKQFNAKYQTWKNTCNNIHSMPNFYKNAEYEELLTLCKSFKNSEFLIYKKLGEGDILSILLVCDLVISESNQNKRILDNIKEEDNNNKRNENNAMIVYSPYSNTMKFVKRLINNSYFPQTRGTASLSEQGVKYSNSENFIVSTTNNGLTISFDLQEYANISLSVVDLQGHQLATILQNKKLGKGSYCYQIEKPTTSACLICYSVDGNLNIKKLNIK